MPASTLTPAPPPPVALLPQPMADPAAPLIMKWNTPARFFGRKLLALDYIKTRGGHPFLYARDKSAECGNKSYFVLDAPPHGIIPDEHLYEMPYIPNDRRFGLDLDGSVAKMPADFDAPATRVIIIGETEALHGTGALDRQELDASDATKFSRHISFSKTRFNHVGILAFVEMLKERLEPFKIPDGFIDWSIYKEENRCMRMPYQTKMGKGRPLLPFNDSSDDTFDHLWNYYDDHTAPLTWTDPRPKLAPERIIVNTISAPDAMRQDVTDLMDMISIDTPAIHAYRNDYNKWVALGGLLFTLGSSVGAPDAFFDDWDTWSSDGAGYKETGEYSCAAKWHTFRPGTGTIGTLRYLAREFNPEAYTEWAAPPVTMDAFRRSYCNAFGLLPTPPTEDDDEGGAERVDAPAVEVPTPGMEVAVVARKPFVVPTGRECDTYERVKTEFEMSRFVVNNPFHFIRVNQNGMMQRMSKATIVDMHANIKLYKAPGAKDKDTVNFMSTWLSDPARRTIEQVDFYPPPMVVPDDCFNTFTGYKAATFPPVANVDLSLILHHIDVIVGHTPGGADYLLNWLAVLLQRAGSAKEKETATAILFKGEQGTGKTKFINWIGEMLIGTEHYNYIDDAENQLFSRFSNGMDQALLVCIDEAEQLHRYAGKFKAFITQTSSMVEVKGIQPVKVNNFARFMLASNVENPIKIEDGCRRFEAFMVSPEHKQDPVYFAELTTWMESKANARAFFDMLMARDVTGVNLQVSRPKTDEFLKMQKLNMPVVIDFLVEQYEARTVDAVKIAGETFRESFMAWARANNRKAVLDFKSTYQTQQFEKWGIPAGQWRAGGKVTRGYTIDWVAVRAAIEKAYPGVPLFVDKPPPEEEGSDGEAD